MAYEVEVRGIVQLDLLAVLDALCSIHLGKGRYIPDANPKFHESVKDRINDKALNYKPRAIWKQGTETYVP